MELHRIEQLTDTLRPFREQLLNHKLYTELNREESLRVFMENHVFAVWDFMSLLKSLQQKLCCVDVPWLPPEDSSRCRLLNEIVLAEESDEDGCGGYASHFELYHSSMKQFGADTSPIDEFIGKLRQGASIDAALAMPRIPAPARQFVQQTFVQLRSGDLIGIASAFTFGREDLLPDVFQKIVDELNARADGRLTKFKYYLDRHIGLDGDEHGPMTHRLISRLCDVDDRKWELATQSAVNCLKARRDLWDGVYNQVAQH